MQKLGVREICEVVLKAKAPTKIGKKVFYKNEPVMYFDTLKTSSLEGAATTVYAQGGKGNPRLVAWEGERTLTFTMEDALISPEGLMILTGAGLVEASDDKIIYQHIVETVDTEGILDATGNGVYVFLDKFPHLPEGKKDNFAYVMVATSDGEMSEPYIPEHGSDKIAFIGLESNLPDGVSKDDCVCINPTVDTDFAAYENKFGILISNHSNYVGGTTDYSAGADADAIQDVFADADHIVIDYYTPKKSGARQIEITPDKFGGNYYLEAETLFRDQNGVDLPAEFIIPNCKIQSNFTFTMASTGDPSTFTFTMDAFPDYTRFDHSKKVLCALQIVDAAGSSDLFRQSTEHNTADDSYFED